MALLYHDLHDMRIPPYLTIISISTIISSCDFVSVNALRVCSHACGVERACKMCMPVIGRSSYMPICDLPLGIIIY